MNSEKDPICSVVLVPRAVDNRHPATAVMANGKLFGSLDRTELGQMVNFCQSFNIFLMKKRLFFFLKNLILRYNLTTTEKLREFEQNQLLPNPNLIGEVGAPSGGQRKRENLLGRLKKREKVHNFSCIAIGDC